MKTDFLAELLADIPEGVANFLNTPFGVIDEIDIPTDEASAKIACGKLAAHLNNAFLRPFSGFTPAEAMMRIGSKSAVHISALLTGMEVISGSGGNAKVERPEAGKTYENFDSILVSGIGIKDVSGGINGKSDQFFFTDQENNWIYTFSECLATGLYTLLVSVTFDDESQRNLSVTFSVENSVNKFGPTAPREGGSYPSTDLIAFSGGGENIEAVAVAIIDGITFQLEQTGEIWSASASFEPGEYAAEFTATFTNGETIPALINFVVT